MAPIAFVEVLGQNERVLFRQPIDALPCHVGRAYDNHVILDDPFVHPRHARVDLDDDGALMWTDLVLNVTTRIDAHQGHACMVGRTKVRLRTPSFKVEAARIAPLLDTRIGRLAGSLSARMVALTLGFACVLGNAYWTSHSTDLVDQVDDVAGVGFLLVLWAAIWTLIGRVRSNRNTFTMHLSAAALSLVPVAIGEFIVAAAYSISPNPGLRILLGATWTALVFAGLITVHCLIIGLPNVRRAAAVGVPLAATALAVTLVMQAASDAQFSRKFEIETLVMPMPTALMVTESPERFFQGTAELRRELEQDLRSP